MFKQYPYINLTDLNLDFLLKAIGEMQNEVKNFVSINAIKYADPIQWDITKSYEKNTVVIDGNSGVAYISVAPVPYGVALTRPEYWTVVFDLSMFITKGAANFANSYEVNPTTTATMDTNEGNWLVWDSTLFQALTDIHAGDSYVIDGNIKQITVEDFYNILLGLIANNAQAINDEVTERANEDMRIQLELSDLITSKVGVEAQTRADEDARIQLELTDLITSKVGIEAQTRADEDARIQLELTDLINSQISIVEGKMISIYDISKHGAIADGVTDNTAIIQEGIDSGMAVYIPHGVWATNQLNLKYGVKIFGESDGYGTANGSTLKALHNSGSVIRADAGRHKFILRDIAIDGSGTDINCPDGIYIDNGVSDYQIDHVYIKRSRIGVYIGSTGWATVKNCFVENCYSDGFKLENNADYRALQVNLINCLSEKNDGNGYRFINNQGNVAPAGTMLNCATFANSGRGVIYVGGFSAIRMINCFFGSDGNTELEINGNDSGFTATISNCQFELAGTETTGADKATAASGTGYGVAFINGSNVNMSNCFVTNNSAAGMIISNARVFLSNNNIRINCLNSGGADIVIDQVSKLFMTNNVLRSAKAYCLYSTNATDLLSLIGNLYENYTNQPNYINVGNTTAYLVNNVDKNGQIIT